MNTEYSQRLLFEIAVIPFVLQWTNATENCGVCDLTYYCKGSTLNSGVLPVFHKQHSQYGLGNHCMS